MLNDAWCIADVERTRPEPAIVGRARGRTHPEPINSSCIIQNKLSPDVSLLGNRAAEPFPNTNAIPRGEAQVVRHGPQPDSPWVVGVRSDGIHNDIVRPC